MFLLVWSEAVYLLTFFISPSPACPLPPSPSAAEVTLGRVRVFLLLSPLCSQPISVFSLWLLLATLEDAFFPHLRFGKTGGWFLATNIGH